MGSILLQSPPKVYYQMIDVALQFRFYLQQQILVIRAGPCDLCQYIRPQLGSLQDRNAGVAVGVLKMPIKKDLRIDVQG